MAAKLPAIKDLENGLNYVMDHVITSDSAAIVEYVDKLRSQNEGISNDDLAKKILLRKSFKNGLVGAVMGVGGFITLPVTIPSDLICSWRIQASMAFSIAYVYGYTTDLKTDLYIILAGDTAKESLKRFGIEASKAITKKAVEKYITLDVMKKIWSVLGRKIITKADEKSLTSFTKMIPLVGAPVGFVFDWVSTLVVGRFAINYYKI